MLKRLKKLRKKYGEYNRIANIEEMGRRYFAMNSFDGLLTILGILVGSYVAGIDNSKIIISTGFAACIAMGVSGIWGTYLTEEAERKKKIKELSRLTLHDLSSTKIGKAEKVATIVVSVIDGLAPFLSALIVLTPFFMHSFIPTAVAYYMSVILALVFLMFLGGFLGFISKENVFLNGLKMLLAGIVSMGLILFLGVAA